MTAKLEKRVVWDDENDHLIFFEISWGLRIF